MDDKLSITILYCTAVFQSSTLLCLLLYIYVILDYIGRRDTYLPISASGAFLSFRFKFSSTFKFTFKFRFGKDKSKTNLATALLLVIIIIIKKMTREEVVVVLPNKKKKNFFSNAGDDDDAGVDAGYTLKNKEKKNEKKEKSESLSNLCVLARTEKSQDIYPPWRITSKG